MNININENIKKLRKRKDITQEELAEHLGISFQSISKWERGEGFPDITMLPDLAAYFNVSVDELLGANKIYGGDIFDIYKQAHELETNGNYDAAVELLKDTLKKEPYHYDLTAKLASVLLKLNNNSKEGKDLAKKAVSLCENKLNFNSGASEKSRATARAMVCFLYDNIGEQEKAVYLARNLPHIWESREVLWGELMEGQKQIDYLKKLIIIVLSVINDKIDRIYNNSKKINMIDYLFFSPPCDDVITPENKREIIEKIIKFLD